MTIGLWFTFMAICCGGMTLVGLISLALAILKCVEGSPFYVRPEYRGLVMPPPVPRPRSSYEISKVRHFSRTWQTRVYRGKNLVGIHHSRSKRGAHNIGKRYTK